MTLAPISQHDTSYTIRLVDTIYSLDIVIFGRYRGLLHLENFFLSEALHQGEAAQKAHPVQEHGASGDAAP